MAFVKLTLNSNKLNVLINTKRIVEFYADTDKDGLFCTKIVTDDGDYTTVTESLSQILTAIGKAKGKESSEEERPLSNEIAAKAAVRIIKRFCENNECYNCIFCGENKECIMIYEYPHLWPIPKGE